MSMQNSFNQPVMAACILKPALSVSLRCFDDGEHFRFNPRIEGWVLCVGAKHPSLGRTPSYTQQNHYFSFTAGLHFRAAAAAATAAAAAAAITIL